MFGNKIIKQPVPVYVSKWKDKMAVLCITTKYQLSMILTLVEICYAKKQIQSRKRYRINITMSGIDYAARMVSYYSSLRKSLKWVKKVLLHLLNITIVQ